VLSIVSASYRLGVVWRWSPIRLGSVSVGPEPTGTGLEITKTGLRDRAIPNAAVEGVWMVWLVSLTPFLFIVNRSSD